MAAANLLARRRLALALRSDRGHRRQTVSQSKVTVPGNLRLLSDQVRQTIAAHLREPAATPDRQRLSNAEPRDRRISALEKQRVSRTTMDPLKIIPLGGLGEFGLNMMLIEYGDAAIAVDCGLMFPERRSFGHRPRHPGCQLPARDIKTSSKPSCSPTLTKTTSAPCPIFSKHFDVPIYGTRLTLGLLANKLKEHDLEDTRGYPRDHRRRAVGHRAVSHRRHSRDP